MCVSIPRGEGQFLANASSESLDHGDEKYQPASRHENSMLRPMKLVQVGLVKLIKAACNDVQLITAS